MRPSSRIALTYAIWLQAGVAGIAFLFFRPVVDEGREPVRQVGTTITNRPAIGPGSRLALGSGSGSVELTGRGQREAPEIVPGLNPPDIQQLRPGQGQAGEALEQVAGLYDRLGFQVYAWFLIFGIGYHYLTLRLDLSSALYSAIYALILGVGALIVALLPLIFRTSVGGSVGRVVIRMVLITLIVTLASLTLTLVPEANRPLALTHVTPALMGDSHFILVTLRDALREILVLLAVGQFLYLYKINEAAPL